MSHESHQVPEEGNLSDSHVLESLDREIAFYRTRMHWFFGSTLAAQALVVGSFRTTLVSNPAVSKWVYFVFFLGVSIVAVLFRSSYKRRIAWLRERKKVLAQTRGYHLFHSAYELGLSPSILFLSAVCLVSTLGAILSLAR